jgi:hypothetical protein
MKIKIILIFFIISRVNAQYTDTIYYGENGIVKSRINSYKKRVFYYDSKIQRYKFKETTTIRSHPYFILKGELKSINPEIKDGIFEDYDMFGNYRKYKYLEGEFECLLEYKNVENNSIEPLYPIWMLSEKYDTEKVVTIISNNLKEKITSNEIKEFSSKRFYILIIIEKNGKISNVDINANIKKSTEKKLKEIIYELQLTPGKNKDIYVNTYMTIPLRI